MKKNFVVYLAVMLMTAIPALSGASVIYTFEAGPSPFDGLSGAFTYTTPDFITADRLVEPSGLDTCVVTFPSSDICLRQEFAVDTSTFTTPNTGDHYDAIVFGNGPEVFLSLGWVNRTVYYFDNGAFGAVGTYDAVGIEPGRLTVSLSSVPLPASLWLLGSGLIVLARAARRTHSS